MEFSWSRCVICQQKSAEPLKCPLESLRTGGETFYSSFLENVEVFRSIKALPTDIYFTADDFKQHHASWHKSCHLKYSNSKLKKAQKRKATNLDDSEERRPSKCQALNIRHCMFCEKGMEEGDLHHVLTFDADKNIRGIVSDLQDNQLLAQIGSGDLIAKETKYHLKCLTSLRNRYRSHQRKFTQAPEVMNLECLWN